MSAAVDIEGITAEWLSGALGYKVHSVSQQRIGTGQTAAAYRLSLDAEKGPATMLAKVAGGDEASRQRVAQGFACEVGFYTELVGSLDVRVPECYFAAISDDSLKFTVLLEDLAPRQPGVQVDGVELGRARAAIQNLAGLHAPRWNDPALLEMPFLMNTRDEATAAFLQELTCTAVEEFVERYEGELGAENVATLRAAAKCVAKWVLASPAPFTILHGDYRPDNLMFGEEETDVVALDWQTAAIGPPARDLAYFLGTSVDVEARREHERGLVEYYHNELKARGVDDYSFDACFHDYRLGHLQATVITCIGAIYATAERTGSSDAMFLAMATRSCAAIRDLNTLELLGS